MSKDCSCSGPEIKDPLLSGLASESRERDRFNGIEDEGLAVGMGVGGGLTLSNVTSELLSKSCVVITHPEPLLS
jgi:hypothetical protein